jgi:hypothetical protein
MSTQRDEQFIELNTLFYPKEYPQVFGLGFQTYGMLPGIGWGTNFSFSEGGKSVMGEGWGLTITQSLSSGGEPDATVVLGKDYSYKINNKTSVEYSSPLPLREDLAGYLISPEGMRDRGVAAIQALAGKVEDAIRSHQAPTCDYQPYQGNGIPPACLPRPMSADEESAELARAKSFFADQEGLLRDHYQEMYAAWMAPFPLDQCWP